MPALRLGRYFALARVLAGTCRSCSTLAKPRMRHGYCRNRTILTTVPADLKTLAEHRSRHGVIVHQIDKGLFGGLNLLVVSPASLSQPYVQAEYAVLMDRAIRRLGFLIPVLLVG